MSYRGARGNIMKQSPTYILISTVCDDGMFVSVGATHHHSHEALGGWVLRNESNKKKPSKAT